MNKKIILIILAVLIIGQISAKVKLPELKMLVTDNAGVLNSNQERELESALRALEQSSTAEVAVVTVRDLEGLSIEEYSIRLVEKWQLGKSDRDNGVLLLVSTGDRKVRLEVGYGLEGVLTDAHSSYIINTKIIPAFREGSYYEGIKSGVLAVSGEITRTSTISPEELAKYERSKNRRQKEGGIPVGVIIFLLFIILSGRRRRGILPWLLMGSMMGGRGSSRGGFGSGGFGGFSGGGGSFGGGGASGGW